jgi:hypothetical protein
MKAVLASASSPGSSYFGALDFLDSQIAFDVISSARPVPRLVAASSTGVSVDSILLTVVLDKFIDRANFISLFHIFDSMMLPLLLVTTPRLFTSPSRRQRNFRCPVAILLPALGLTCNHLKSFLPTLL